jgi:peptidylamidoglycolate lyase
LLLLFIASYCFQSLKKGKGISRRVSYVWVKNWPQLLDDIILGNPTGIAVDTNGNIIVFHCGRRKWPLVGAFPETLLPEKAILVPDHESGKIIASWGANLFVIPHGLRVDDQDNIWVTDVGLHQVIKFTHDDQLLMTVGEARVPGSDRDHF